MNNHSPGTDALYATVSLGTSSFRARVESALAPASCQALSGLLPYRGTVLHARWSGEAVWSPLRASWPGNATLPEENATGQPRPGQLLLYAGRQSEAEILIAYGETRFACNSGPLSGNPVLTILERLDELAHVGRSILESGASTLRIELVRNA